MIIAFIATMLTTAAASAVLTAVVSVAIKNQLLQRRTRQLQHWQARALRAEDPEWQRTR